MDDSFSTAETTAIALSRLFRERCPIPLMPILKCNNSVELILPTVSSRSRYLPLFHQRADFRFAPFHAARLALQDAFPRGIGPVVRQKQKRPGLRRRRVARLAERRRVVGWRTLRCVRQDINAEPVGKIIDFAGAAINGHFERDKPGQLRRAARAISAPPAFPPAFPAKNCRGTSAEASPSRSRAAISRP